MHRSSRSFSIAGVWRPGRPAEFLSCLGQAAWRHGPMGGGPLVKGSGEIRPRPALGHGHQRPDGPTPWGLAGPATVGAVRIAPCRGGGRAVLLAGVLASLLLTLASAVEARPRVAVLPFKTGAGFDYPLGEGLAQLLRKRIMETGKVQVVDREDLHNMKGELQLANDGYFDPSTFPEKGGFQGADYLIVGRVLDFGHYSRDTTLGALSSMVQVQGLQHKKTTAYVRLGIEVIDLATGRLALSEEAEGKNQTSGAILMAGDLKKIFVGGLKVGNLQFDNSMIGRATKQSLDRLIGRLAALFVKEAKVLAVSPEGIVIDMGASSGLQVGMKGRIFATREIKNTAGRVVWKSRRQVAEGVVAEVQPEDALLHCPATGELKEGDVVIFDQ